MQSYIMTLLALIFLSVKGQANGPIFTKAVWSAFEHKNCAPPPSTTPGAESHECCAHNVYQSGYTEDECKAYCESVAGCNCIIYSLSLGSRCWLRHNCNFGSVPDAENGVCINHPIVQASYLTSCTNSGHCNGNAISVSGTYPDCTCECSSSWTGDECGQRKDDSLALIKNCRWESNHDQTPNSADYMGWTCADNEILTGFGLSANQHDVMKVQCCKLGGHSSVKPNTCTYVDSNHERAKCGNGNDHMVFSGAYDKRAATVDAVTEILAGKCCEVECDSAWCAGKDWGVDKNNCQVISTSNTNAQELVCPAGTLLTEVEDGLAGNAHGVQKVASVTCCALDLIAPPTIAPTTARPTSAPTQAPTTSMPTLAPTSTGDCLVGLLRDMQLTDSEYLSGIDRCLPGCRSQPYVPHRRSLLSEKNRRQ